MCEQAPVEKADEGSLSRYWWWSTWLQIWMLIQPAKISGFIFSHPSFLCWARWDIVTTFGEAFCSAPCL